MHKIPIFVLSTIIMPNKIINHVIPVKIPSNSQKKDMGR